MTAKELEETLTTIATKAKALREAGVVGRVTIGDISFALEGGVQPLPVPTQEQADDEPTGDLDDPDTFGGQMPHRRKAPPTTQNKE